MSCDCSHMPLHHPKQKQKKGKSNQRYQIKGKENPNKILEFKCIITEDLSSSVRVYASVES